MTKTDGAKAEVKKRRGRPKKYDSPAERIAAFRENLSGHRYDIYLYNDANMVMLHLMKMTGLSASKVLNEVLTKKLPITKGA